MPDPALALNDNSVIVHHNPLFADFYSRARTGSSIALLSRKPDLLASIDKVRALGDALVVDLHDRVPVERRMSAFVSRIATQEQTPDTPTILVVLRDLTVQQKHSQMRADFIAHASHELRTPLASLKLMAETLLGPARKDPEKRERFLPMMLSQATRMGQLVDDLLSLSRIEMNAHLPPRDNVDLNKVLLSVIQTTEPLAEAHNIETSFVNNAAAAKVRGDNEQLSQVFQNLVENAIRYGHSGGHVWLSVMKEEAQADGQERVRISVADDGMGIAEEHITRLTERFYRVSNTESRARGGTGLGLAIVKHILTRHRAHLHIESKLGKGSVFSVLIDAT